MATTDPNVLSVLRKACKTSGLPHSGNKQTLVDRLIKHQDSAKAMNDTSNRGMQDGNVTIPTEFYETVKKELMTCGIYDPKKLHEEIVQQYKFQVGGDDGSVDESVFTLPKLLPDVVCANQNLVYVECTDQGEFRYKKQPVAAAKPVPPAGPSAFVKVASSSMMPPKMPPPKLSGAISKADGKKPNPSSPSSLKAMLQKAKEVVVEAVEEDDAVEDDAVEDAPVAEDDMEKMVTKTAVMEFIAQRLMDKALPVHVTAMLGDFMPSVPARGTTKDYCDCLALALLEDSDSEE